MFLSAGEDVRPEQPVEQHQVHGGDEAQAHHPGPQHQARHVFGVSCQPAAHPARHTQTKHHKPADDVETKQEEKKAFILGLSNQDSLFPAKDGGQVPKTKLNPS